MNKSLCKKIILSLLNCVPKSAKDITSEINESLTAIQDNLAQLASENICEEVSANESSQWIIREDIETFAQLAKEFLKNGVLDDEQKSKFVTSKYYLTKINHEFVDFVIQRFHLDLAYQTDDEKEALRRILLASPSALVRVLHADAQIFDKMWSSQNQLDTSDPTRQWFGELLVSQFQTPLLDMLIADMKVPAYGLLYAALGIRVAKIKTHVSLATMGEKYVEAAGGGSFSLVRAMEDIGAGQFVSADNPMIFSEMGVALMHLGDFQAALEHFDKALNALEDPIDKAIVLNNKGLAFHRLNQYQRAIECYEAGIEFDSDSQLAPLRENKRLAEDRLAKAADLHNFTQPTHARFFQGQTVPFEETRFYEFKEVSSRNPASSIENTADEYAVSILNREGGRLFWGIRDSDRITIGVTLNDQDRNETRSQVSQKLCQIQPPISVKHWQLEFHPVHNLQGQSIPNLWVIELAVPPPQERDIFYTGSNELFVKTEGGKKKLKGPEATEFIRRHLQNDTQTD